MKKSKNKTFYVNARLGLEVCIPITANSLEEAIQKSKDLEETDFVEILGDYNDGDMRISGVFEGYEQISI